MSKIETYRREYMRCWKCGSDIIWDNRIVEDRDNFRGVSHKAQYHIDNDPACLREVYLSELLGEKKEPIPPIAGVDQTPDRFIVREITINNNKDGK